MIELIELILGGIIIGSMYALVGLSLVLVYKSTHVISMAHGQLLAFGALFFYMFLVGLHLPLIISLFLAFVCIILVGLIIERFALRPLIGRSLFTNFMMTFSVFLAMDGLFELILMGQALSYPSYISQSTFGVGPVILSVAQGVSFFSAIAIFVALTLFFRYTKIGLSMRAAAENHRLAQSAGISVKRIFALIWMISAAVACMGGITTALAIGIHYPLPYLGIKGMVVALCGGLDSIGGALVVGISLGVMEQLASGYLDPIIGSGTDEVVVYLILLAVMLIKPYGLFGLMKIERI